jgi:hypothetical protein
MLRPETRVVHWYASGAGARAAEELDPTRVMADAHRQPFCALALSTVQGRRFLDTPALAPVPDAGQKAPGRAPA